jgi:hypothetical protein
VNRLIVTHGLFSLFANPVHYVLPVSLVVLALGSVAMGIAVVQWSLGAVSAFMAIFGVGLLTLGIILFVLAVVARQGNMISTSCGAAATSEDGQLTVFESTRGGASEIE